MKKIAIILTAILLSGCGYSRDEIRAAKSVCIAQGGQFGLLITGQLVTSTNCTVDNVKYRIGRSDYKLLDGKVTRQKDKGDD